MAGFDYRRDVWEPLRDRIQSEGWPWYECGSWTIEKLYVVGHYFALTSQAMAGNPAFSSLNYVDLFCGPGIDVIRERTDPIRYPGSPLLAASCPKPFSRILLVDEDKEKVRACETRVRVIDPRVELKTWTGDANSIVRSVVAEIPDRSLTIVFADPYSVGALRFEAVELLASRGRVDLIILFADRMDIGRNLKAYFDGRSTKLDEFLGDGSSWRERFAQLNSHEPDKVRAFFAREYCKQLMRIGYEHFRTREIRSERGPLYRLVYASKSIRGLKFWDIAASYDFDGSKDLWSS